MDPAALTSALLPHLQRAGFVGADARDGDRDKAGLLAAALQERLVAFGDAVEQSRWAYEPVAGYEGKAEKNLKKGDDVSGLLRAYAVALPDPLPDPDAHEAHARAFAESRDLGFGRLVHPLRAAWTGRPVGPPLFDIAAILGRDEVITRLEQAAAWAGEHTSAES